MEKYEKTTFAKEINKILRKLADGQSKITVFCPETERRYNATLMSFDENFQVIGISTLQTESGSASLPDSVLEVTCSHQGIKYKFQTRLVYRNITFTAHELAVPDTIEYLQRRHFYRTFIIGGANYAVDLPDKSAKKSITGRLIDISVGGCRVGFDKGKGADAVKVGDMIENCTISLGNREAVSINVAIRSKTESAKGSISLGLQFLDLSMITETKIERFVAVCDREYRRYLAERMEDDLT